MTICSLPSISGCTIMTDFSFRELRPLNAEEHQYTSIHPNQPVIFDEFEKALEHLLKSQTVSHCGSR